MRPAGAAVALAALQPLLLAAGAAASDAAVAPPAAEPAYYSARYRLVGTLCQGVVLAVGLAGNLLVVAVVCGARSMRSPTNCYLVSLAMADCLVLVASVPNEIASYYLVGNQWLWGDAGCAAFVFSQNLGINASALSLVAFTVERYVAICSAINPILYNAMSAKFRRAFRRALLRCARRPRCGGAGAAAGGGGGGGGGASASSSARRSRRTTVSSDGQPQPQPQLQQTAL